MSEKQICETCGRKYTLSKFTQCARCRRKKCVDCGRAISGSDARCYPCRKIFNNKAKEPVDVPTGDGNRWLGTHYRDGDERP